jgi:prepilin-type N-terminal cleavage/methylation domain-containing protein
MSRAEGFTLLEVMVSVVVLAVVGAAIMQSVATAYRTQRSREMHTRVQGESRDALRTMEQDLRAASLGTTSGIVFGDSSPPALAVDPTAVAKRPAVQIFDNVPGGSALLPVKPGTDAVLVVAAQRGTTDAMPEALVAGGTHHDATGPIQVTEAGWFTDLSRDRYVLVGAASATWARVRSVNGGPGPGQLRLDLAAKEAFPDGKADAGTRIRLASAHLYFVDTRDRLVRVSLTAPRPPVAVDEAFDLVLLAEGIENLQIDCETEGGLGVLGGCAAVIPDVPMHRLVEEAKVAGLAGPGSGPRFTDASIASLRMVHLTAVARSLQPVPDQERGEDPIAIGNQVALRASSHPEARYARRVFRLPVGVRNTSLGAL